MNLYFKATHSSGRVHTRATSGTPYTWACVGAGRNSATFHTRQDLARAEQSRRMQWDPTLEVTAAVVIEKSEHTATVKASKASFKVVYLGKTYTKTCSVESTRPYVCAVGYDQPEHKQWIARTVNQETLDHTKKFNTARYEQLLEQNRAGGYELVTRAQRGVFWFTSREEAEQYLAQRREHQLRADAIPTTHQLLELA